MDIYHGSERIIETPRYGLGRLHNDYGRGFYCTEHKSMAMEWAVGFDHDGYANHYSIELNGLDVLDFDDEGYCTLHWLAALLKNRWFDVRAPLAHEARSYLLDNFSIDLSEFDVIEGYRADDSYFTFAQDFIAGSISYRQLNTAMKLGELGRQIMIRSERAFSRLEFIDAQEALRPVWLPRREQRDRDARNRYFDSERNARRKGDLFIAEIIDEQMKAGDERLR